MQIIDKHKEGRLLYAYEVIKIISIKITISSRKIMTMETGVNFIRNQLLKNFRGYIFVHLHIKYMVQFSFLKFVSHSVYKSRSPRRGFRS